MPRRGTERAVQLTATSSGHDVAVAPPPRGQPHTVHRHDRQMVAERQSERIMVPGKRQNDQDQEATLPTPRGTPTPPPRMACDGMLELSLSPVLAAPSCRCQASLAGAFG